MWEADAVDIVHSWYILSYAYKWEGEKTRWVGLCDYIGYKPNTCDSKEFILGLWNLIDEADIIIAQNGDKFDIPRLKTRFLHYNLPPPSPFRSIDTLKAARTFGFPSNKLDNLGQALGEGRKVKHTGFSVWNGCMGGDRKFWGVMKRYNIKDVDLLARIYKRFRPWMSKHPNLLAGNRDLACPKCQSKDYISRGVATRIGASYKQYSCKNCGGWFHESKAESRSSVKNA